jgi:nitrogen fixation NifU-like protein
MYSEQVLEHFQNPRFVGDLADATVTVELENPACGDVLRLALKIEGGRIADVRFRAKGCVPAIACGSKLAEMLHQKRISEVQIEANDLISALGGLPAASGHASHLAIDVLRQALRRIGTANAAAR